MQTILDKLLRQFERERYLKNPILFLTNTEYQELNLFMSCNPYSFPFLEATHDGFRYYGIKVAMDTGNVTPLRRARKRLELISA